MSKSENQEMIAKQLLSKQIASGTRVEKFISNTEKLGLNNITYDIVNTRLDLLERYWAEMLITNTKLHSHSAELADDEYFTADKFSDYENAYVVAKAYLTSKIGDFITDAQGRVPVSHYQSTAITGQQQELRSSGTSVPFLKRPSFSGRQEDWETFKETFTAMIKNDSSMMPTLKLQHLISCLEGDAARRLSNFRVTGANFDVAWQALCRRYDNHRLRLSTQLNSILKCPPIGKRSVAEFSRLIDTMAQSIRALKLLNRPVEHWDDWFIQLTVTKLDASTREDWEKSLEGTDEFPTYDQLVLFLENRIKSIETARSNDSSSISGKSKPSQVFGKSVTVHHSSSTPTTRDSAIRVKPKTRTHCILCKGDHYINYCPEFAKRSVTSRLQLVKELRLCHNCLSSQHMDSHCSSKYLCKTCGSAHHTLLHGSQDPHSSAVAHATNTIVYKELPEEQSTSNAFGRKTLLGTAVINLIGKAGDSIKVRALIDPCSEGSFINEKAAQSLRLVRTPLRLSISGVGGLATAQSSATVRLSLRSRIDPNATLSFSAAVLSKLTKLLPQQRIERKSWEHLRGLQLADPNFAEPSSIDCILGADVYPLIILPGLRTGIPGSPIAQQTSLGWILTGPATAPIGITPINSFTTTVSRETDLSEQLRRFWEIEETTCTKKILTDDEKACEEHFCSTHCRDTTGRYVVRLPFKEKPTLTGSRKIALRRLTQMERRFQKDVHLQQAYGDFMKEYEELGHMRRSTYDQVLTPDMCYIPHHAVVQSDSKKLRVVFDAAQVAGERCLNDYLYTGVKLQTDITTILMRWRIFRYVFTADIVKMFRQVRVHPNDVTWQRIIWRPTIEDAITDYELLTVTYGTACAPYLANRVLRQLALDEGARFPIGAKILQEHTYVDDILAGAHCEEDARDSQRQLISILSTAGMQLDKWGANFPLTFSRSDEVLNQEHHIDAQDNVSILGLRWMPKSDAFAYKVRQLTTSETTTKRGILSNIAKLYDPLGWLAPLIIRAKILLQQLWITGMDWDAPVDSSTQSSWTEYCQQLPMLQKLSIPRWLGTKSKEKLTLHGFSDASEKAYAATVYAVARDTTTARASLLVAKSKVAPIKTISLPRLELCGALLLARLISQLIKEMDWFDISAICWCDSQVVLAWLNDHPSNWKTFVANRTSEILNLLPNVRWKHVASKDNPADLATRGLSVPQLIDNELWWHGPRWLLQEADNQPSKPNPKTLIEKRTKSINALLAQADEDRNLFKHFSSWTRMLRVIAYMRRWRRLVISGVQDRPSLELSATELRLAKVAIINAVQHETYSSEISRLTSTGKSLHGSTIRKLKPFIDDCGTLRVGGRLQLSYLPYEEKHPAILPGKHHVTELIIRYAHAVTLHGGPQLTQSFLRRSFWITSARIKIKAVIRKCVRCTRFQGHPLSQQMAPLPAVRVTPSRPFAFSGVDYTGPFPVRTTKGRGYKSTKGYVAVFICMVTRAVHLEVVSDYSSETFLAAFYRFVARRGLCHTVYSDNGTNFRGADSELQRLFREASKFSTEVSAAVANDGIQWSYNPPKAPHFGGLWEAAVKSFKHHLKRVLGDATLTFEEFSTLAAHIEACLNSRPLSAISTDPTDYSALTPGHFLIGGALKAPPEAPSPQEPRGLRRWEHVHRMRNHFWQRWHKEVIHELQQRSKWLESNASLQIGNLVLITDEQLPPQQWPLARVQEIHPGPDGLVRVLTLKTETSLLKRPIHRVVLLPINEVANHSVSNLKDVATAGGTKSQF